MRFRHIFPHRLRPAGAIQAAESAGGEDRLRGFREEHHGDLKKLESFGTRNILSTQDNPTRGVGAARKWIYEQFRSYSPKLEVSFDQYRLKKIEGRASRVPRDVDLYNVVAVLPGTTNKEQRIIISGHYDTIVMGRPTGAPAPLPRETPAPPPMRDPDLDAPGVTDDGSGTACVMELARVLSHYEFEKTLVFVTFAGEEEGLLGSFALRGESARRQSENRSRSEQRHHRQRRLRLRPHGQPPRQRFQRRSGRFALARARPLYKGYRRAISALACVSTPIFRADRFGRGGDHTGFNLEGFTAVRLSSPEENFANQHTVTDTFANTSVPYITLVTKVNGAAAASLAWAPKPPVTAEVTERNGQKVTTLFSDARQIPLRRGAEVETGNPEADLAGYVIVYRSTTSPYWEHEVFVGKVTEYTLPDVSIDDLVFGVKAIDKDGNESLVSPYVQAPRVKRKIEVY